MLTGLVVGKFSPLHRGHEALIEFAQARCDRLVILSYSKPEFSAYPPERRAAWLAALFPDAVRLVLSDEALAAGDWPGKPDALPHNDAPADEHRHFVAWACRAILGLTVDRVFTSEDYGDGFAAALAQEFAHPVEHIPFDLARGGVPVSGTMLRADRSLHEAYLPDIVRRDLLPGCGRVAAGPALRDAERTGGYR